MVDHHIDRVIVRPQPVEVRVILSGSTEAAELARDVEPLGELATTTVMRSQLSLP